MKTGWLDRDDPANWDYYETPYVLPELLYSRVLEVDERIGAHGDVLAAPAWNPIELKADADAVLLEVSDSPTLRMLGFYREG